MRLTNLFLIVLIVISSIFSLTTASAAPIDKLESEANKLVAGKYANTSKEFEDGTLFLAYSNENQEGFQFTVSEDQEPGLPDAIAFEYKGKKAFFFQPMGETSGSIMVLLSTSRSLVIAFNYSMMSDNEVTKEMMVEFLDKMNLEAIE
jgi:hypothetical protein